MRLTLRTLLAYLDGILDPNDAQDLGKKVEESEYAASLVHRIRDVMRRLRLGSPGLTDRGPGLDPNTVAEYLDNTLATERVTDFEKVCLDSDIHLAEVASCHQILTLVLGEPAEIDPACRQRIYLLKDHQGGAKPPPPPVMGANSAAPVVSSPPSLDLGVEDDLSASRKSRLKPTVPEYLRETRKRPKWLPATAAAVLAVCVLGAVLMAFGQFEPGTPLGNMLVSMGMVSAPPDVAMKSEEKPSKNGEKNGKEESPPVEKKSAGTAQEPPVKSSQTPTKEPSAKTVQTPSTQPVQAPPKKVEPEKFPSGISKTPDTVLPGTEPKTPPPPTPDVKTPLEPEAAVGNKAGTAPEPKQEPEAPHFPPEPVGRLMSSDQVLFALHPTAGWVRTASDQVLMPCHLLVPPTYRVKIALSSGVTLEILSGTRIELLRGGPKELPGVRVLYGRVEFRPLAKDKSLRVAFGDRSGVITFSDADSVAALEAHRVRVPGTNPESEPPNITADLDITAGGVSWDETIGGKRGPPLQLLPLQRLNFYAQLTSAPIPMKHIKTPAAPSISFADGKASPVIAQALQSDGPAKVGLLQLATVRPQKEVKWLALRCLGYIGQFHDMIMALNDPDRKLDWPEYIEELRAAVGRDPETAAAVRMALEKQWPQQAFDLYRMLWGYTDKDLQSGEDSKLVRALDDNDVLAVRVLGIWNLKNITGLGNQYYQPEQPPAKRQQYMRRWRERRDKNEIRLKTSEDNAPAAQPVAPPEPGGETAPLPQQPAE